MANGRSSGILAASVPWRPKHYILTGMAIILAASTVIIVTSIILSPARIHFSITKASGAHIDSDDKKGVSFNFTLTVDNPSRRAGVEYRDVIVNLQLSKKHVRRNSVPANSVPARVNKSMPLYQPPHSNISMAVTAFVETSLSALYFNPKNSDHPRSRIMVTALVRFKVGVAYSRLYDITTSCSHVDFFNVSQSQHVICSA